MLRRTLNAIAVAASLLTIALSCWSQTPDLDPKSQASRVPVVIFDFNWTSSQPSHYVVAVDSTGTAAYRSDETAQSGEDKGDPYILKFVVSEPTRSKIFELAKDVNFFKGNFDFTKNRVAQTGTKTLTYTEGNLINSFEHPVKGTHNQTTYNWSQNPAIQELTNIFQGMSTTFELGRRLDFKKRFDKLGLDAELKTAEQLQKAGSLQQLQVIAPVLKNIANDTSVMHVARERARRLLATAEETSETAATRQ